MSPDPSAGSRWPCRAGRSTARSGAPAASGSTLRAADLEDQIVLVAGAHLADREAAPRAVVEPQHHRREVLDLDVDEIECLVRAGGGERFARPLRFLSLRNHRRDVAEHFGDAQAADVLREIAPVRADVAERRRGAALVRLEPPRVVRVLEQPVLQVVADEEMRLADVARAIAWRACCTSGLPR